jgi:hypothetical protein
VDIVIRVVTSDVFRENHVQRTSSERPIVRTNVRVGRPPVDGTSGRPVGRPSGQHLVDGHRTACRPPLHPADGMADSHPTASRPLRTSVGWRTAAPADGRADGLADGLADPSAWAVRQGPSARGRPPGAVRQKPSARGRPLSRNFGGP